MSKEVFEQANEAFIDDKYEQAYEVNFQNKFNNILLSFLVIC